jgi:hypothetical protein
MIDRTIAYLPQYILKSSWLLFRDEQCCIQVSVNDLQSTCPHSFGLSRIPMYSRPPSFNS